MSVENRFAALSVEINSLRAKPPRKMKPAKEPFFKATKDNGVVKVIPTKHGKAEVPDKSEHKMAQDEKSPIKNLMPKLHIPFAERHTINPRFAHTVVHTYKGKAPLGHVSAGLIGAGFAHTSMKPDTIKPEDGSELYLRHTFAGSKNGKIDTITPSEVHVHYRSVRNRSTKPGAPKHVDQVFEVKHSKAENDEAFPRIAIAHAHVVKNAYDQLKQIAALQVKGRHADAHDKINELIKSFPQHADNEKKAVKETEAKQTEKTALKNHAKKSASDARAKAKPKPKSAPKVTNKTAEHPAAKDTAAREKQAAIRAKEILDAHKKSKGKGK